MSLTSNIFLSVNVGLTPNDGLGDPLRTAFIKLNENFEHFTSTIWPNVQVDRLVTDITSFGTSQFLGTSQFNNIEADDIQASTIGNSTTSFVGNSLTITNFSVSDVIANNVTANSLTVTNFSISDVIANNVTANSLNGVLGSTGANNAFITNLIASESSTLNNITANSIQVLNIGNVTPGVGNFSNLYANYIILQNNSVISDVKWLSRTIIEPSQILGNTNLNLNISSTSSQYRLLLLGNASVTQANISYANISAGVERVLVFKNNVAASATRYIILPNNFNNLNQTNIAVTATGSIFLHLIPFDNTEANVYAFIANS
jgi:hypothetical protein